MELRKIWILLDLKIGRINHKFNFSKLRHLSLSVYRTVSQLHLNFQKQHKLPEFYLNQCRKSQLRAYISAKNYQLISTYANRDQNNSHFQLAVGRFLKLLSQSRKLIFISDLTEPKNFSLIKYRKNFHNFAAKRQNFSQLCRKMVKFFTASPKKR